jgi:hypothetical protein
MKVLHLLDQIVNHPVTVRLMGWYPVLFRAFLYFSIEALPGIIKGCREFGTSGARLNNWLLWAFVLEAFYHGFVGLRAYFDGSALRLRPQTNGGGTAFIHKPHP